jgi:hypothetical protein
VPTDPDFGKPVHPCPPAGGVPHPPIWAWVPDRPDFGGKPTPAPTKTTLYPTGPITVTASGSSGSINVTTDPVGGSWTVDPASVPAWLTINPMGSTSADVNLTYKALANDDDVSRTATIKVNDATLTFNQGA